MLPASCDSGVVVGGSSTVLLKNSDRDANEEAEVVFVPPLRHFDDGAAPTTVRCTYISVPQV
jgi:hypothetical protein